MPPDGTSDASGRCERRLRTVPTMPPDGTNDTSGRYERYLQTVRTMPPDGTNDASRRYERCLQTVRTMPPDGTNVASRRYERCLSAGLSKAPGVRSRAIRQSDCRRLRQAASAIRLPPPTASGQRHPTAAAYCKRPALSDCRRLLQAASAIRLPPPTASGQRNPTATRLLPAASSIRPRPVSRDEADGRPHAAAEGREDETPRPGRRLHPLREPVRRRVETPPIRARAASSWRGPP